MSSIRSPRRKRIPTNPGCVSRDSISLPTARAAVCTWNGDVWIVSGIDDKLEALKWKRFATGLNNPMGIKIIDGVIHTIGRDQITKLHDLNNDGEADFYENINNECFLTTNFHEMCFDLQTDKDGNFFFTKGSSIWAGEQRMTPHNGTVVKVSKDGSKFETICNGLRAPNGLAIGPNGEITVSDNQGNWIPSCPINFHQERRLPLRLGGEGAEGIGFQNARQTALLDSL